MKHLFLGLFIIFAIICIGFVLTKKSPISLPQTITFQKYNTMKQQPITEWKTYTNKTYGFSLKYPAYGYAQDPKCFTGGPCTTLHVTQCGNDIHEETILGEKNIIVDNMIGIFIQPLKKPLPSIQPSFTLKKGDYIFTLLPLQNPGSKTGCLPPAGTNANPFNSKYWNIPKSFSFTNN